MDGAKIYYRYSRGTHLSVLVNRRLFSAEVSLRRELELEGMRILAGVGTDFAENCKRPKEQGFLGNIN